MLIDLTFVHRYKRFSTYRDRNGEIVYLAHQGELGEDPFTRFEFDFDMDDIREFWEEMQTPPRTAQIGDRRSSILAAHATQLAADRENFKDFLRATLTTYGYYASAAEADEVDWCQACGDLECTVDGRDVRDRGFTCDSCVDARYRFCNRCEEYVDDVSSTLDDDYDVCYQCRDNNYTFCDNCDGYYPNDEAGEHDHDEGGYGCCESPQLDFTIRNDGHEPLANDTRVCITLPASEIDLEGINRIKRYLMNEMRCAQCTREICSCYHVGGVVNSIGNASQTREGNYAKRLSRALYQQMSMKIPPDVLSEVGNIAAAHSTAKDFDIEVTRNLNMSADDFGNGSSCWWNSYGSSRCALKTNGGFGLRTFGNWDTVTGRSWVIPLKLDDRPDPHHRLRPVKPLRPTFNTETPHAFIVFNGYGQLQGYNAARIIAHMAGWTYRKINFACSPMYINSGGGYLVAPEEIAQHYTDGSLFLEVETHASLFLNERHHAHA